MNNVINLDEYRKKKHSFLDEITITIYMPGLVERINCRCSMVFEHMFNEDELWEQW